MSEIIKFKKKEPYDNIILSKEECLVQISRLAEILQSNLKDPFYSWRMLYMPHYHQFNVSEEAFGKVIDHFNNHINEIIPYIKDLADIENLMEGDIPITLGFMKDNLKITGIPFSVTIPIIGMILTIQLVNTGIGIIVLDIFNNHKSAIQHTFESLVKVTKGYTEADQLFDI